MNNEISLLDKITSNPKYTIKVLKLALTNGGVKPPSALKRGELIALFLESGGIIDKDGTLFLKNTTESEIKFQKPILKWVGGKTQIIQTLAKYFPPEMENYHELFMGGGSVLLALLTLQREDKIKINGKVYAYDFNEALINVYKNIQTNKEELFETLSQYIKTYDGIKSNEDPPPPPQEGVEEILLENTSPSTSPLTPPPTPPLPINRKPKDVKEALQKKENYYYWLRAEYNKKYKDTNKDAVDCSALFIFINKTCFRGMYREGPNGYNVPYGHYKKTPTFITKSELDKVSDLIEDVEFIHQSFEESFENIKAGDFVYLDPPYAPENSKSFVGYVADGFNLKTHQNLFERTKDLDKKNSKFIMSNAKVELVTESFPKAEYKIIDVTARRAINAKNPDATTTEVFIMN